MKKDEFKAMIQTRDYPNYHEVYVPYNKYRFQVKATVEELGDRLDSTEVLFSYNEHIILAGMNFDGDSVAAIYEFTKSLR